jgi:hypothetical protein
MANVPDRGCRCRWQDGCGNLGVIGCEGCGEGRCSCICGGEAECGGCYDCEPTKVPAATEASADV